MKKNEFILDRKVLLPRMARFGKRFDPETRMWRDIKSCVTDGMLLDWGQITREFRFAEMVCPKSVEHTSRADHMHLKGLFAFLQMGYIIVADDRVALFNRQKKKNVITRGYSPLICSSASGLQDHSAGERKLKEQIAPSIAIAKVEPFAVAFTELKADASDSKPAYLWLLHKVTLNQKLPRSRSPTS